MHRDGTEIVDGAGQPIKLRGLSLGNWLLWENYFMGASPSNFQGQRLLLKNLTSLVGAPRTAQFQLDVYNHYITLPDIQRIAALGFNSIKVPLAYDVLEDDSNPGVYKASGWQILDNVVSWAQQSGLYVIFDLHAAPGAQNGFYTSAPPPGGAQLWRNADDQTRTVNLWKAIAARYANSTTVAGYDVLNEPLPPTNYALMSLYNRIIPAIRSVDTNHMLILEGTAFDGDLQLFKSRNDDNETVSLHQYLWSSKNPEQQINDAEAVAAKLDVPLWVGEMGNSTTSDVIKQVNRFNTDPAIQGWSFWTWKSVKPLPPGVYMPDQFVPTPAWKKLITWMANSRKPQPTLAEAEQGMQDYIQIIQSATEIPAVIAALQTPPPAVGAGVGLLGQYFAKTNFTGFQTLRVDPQVNFNWGDGAPAAGMSGNAFSVLWTGFVQPQFSQTYTFTANFDDTAQVWIGNTLVLSNLARGRHTASGSISLVAGEKYPIRIQYTDLGAAASIVLRWKSASQANIVIPASQLYPY